MPITKDTQSEVVVKKPLWLRALAWLIVILGIMFLIAGLAQLVLFGSMMVGFGLLFALLGTFLITESTKVNFNKPPGHVTVTLGNYPLFFWVPRTKVISREEAKSVFVYPVEGTFTDAFGNSARKTYAYRVKVVVSSGKEVTLHDDGRADVANHLAKRILDFAQEADGEAYRQKLDETSQVKSSPSAKFSMRVEYAFQATFATGALGMVVEGSVEQGTIQSGDEVEIRGYRGTKRAKVFQVDTATGSAAAGEKVRLLIEDLTEGDVMLGDIVERV